MEIRSIEVIIQALNSAGVEYLIVGGLAVVAHGYERFTKDLDLVIGLQPTNITLGLNTLLNIGYRMSIPITPEEFADGRNREKWQVEKNMIVLQLWSDYHHRTPIDVFISEPFDFAQEFGQMKKEIVFGSVTAPIVSYSTLLEMKKIAGRPRDLVDIDALHKLDPYR